MFQGLFSRITFALPVVLGSPEGHFSNTAHFLETSEAFQGCIRNLEINNKLYNFALQNNGGDAIEGVDIGKSNFQKLSLIQKSFNKNDIKSLSENHLFLFQK